jgi:acetyl-CoA carboxylase biotin carboxyl carrier protein
MNIDDIYRIIDRFENSSLGELTLEMEDVKLSLKSNNCCVAGIAGTDIAGSMVQAAVAAPVSQNADDRNSVNNMTALSEDDAKVIKAPLVGTFYAAPAEGEEPFVKPGDRVKKGDVVGIIEAMKLMNEIEATEEGVVESIEADNGELVEYGQVIIRLK